MYKNPIFVVQPYLRINKNIKNYKSRLQTLAALYFKHNNYINDTQLKKNKEKNLLLKKFKLNFFKFILGYIFLID